MQLTVDSEVAESQRGSREEFDRQELDVAKLLVEGNRVSAVLAKKKREPADEIAKQKP